MEKDKEKEVSTNVIPFQFEGHKIRVILDEHGNPWWVAKDVCDALGYVRANDAVAAHCKHAKMLKYGESPYLEIPPRGLLIIPESDLYRLISKSEMPDAERFQDWVFEDVLPSIRKTGSYVAPGAQIPTEVLQAIEEFRQLKNSVQSIQSSINRQDRQIMGLQDKVRQITRDRVPELPIGKFEFHGRAVRVFLVDREPMILGMDFLAIEAGGLLGRPIAQMLRRLGFSDQHLVLARIAELGERYGTSCHGVLMYADLNLNMRLMAFINQSGLLHVRKLNPEFYGWYASEVMPVLPELYAVVRQEVVNG